MPRYIDAELLLRKSIEEKRFFIYTENLIKGGYDVQTVYNDLAEFVESIPTADVVEVKHGYWKDNTNGTFTCSECGGRASKMDWCGCCGAKMDGKKVE